MIFWSMPILMKLKPHSIVPMKKTMFFEKKRNKEPTKTSALLNKLIILFLTFLASVIIYIIPPLPADFWTIKLIDLINALAQSATAGAFLFAVFQYRKSKESDRQPVLIKECRDLIDRVCGVCSDFSDSPRHAIHETTKLVTKMRSLGGSFDEIFKELIEGTHKAIVRMHWQEMFFSDLQHAMEFWNLVELFADLSVSAAQKDTLRLTDLRGQRLKHATKEDIFEEYKSVKTIL